MCKFSITNTFCIIFQNIHHRGSNIVPKCQMNLILIEFPFTCSPLLSHLPQRLLPWVFKSTNIYQAYIHLISPWILVQHVTNLRRSYPVSLLFNGTIFCNKCSLKSFEKDHLETREWPLIQNTQRQQYSTIWKWLLVIKCILNKIAH